MNIALIIVGVVIVVGIIVAVCVSASRTPDNLGGYYGAMFWTIGGIGIVGALIAAIYGLVMLFM